jgi:hypothetical protein
MPHRPARSGPRRDKHRRCDLFAPLQAAQFGVVAAERHGHASGVAIPAPAAATACASHPRDHAVTSLITALSGDSARFRELWARQDIRDETHGVKLRRLLPAGSWLRRSAGASVRASLLAAIGCLLVLERSR